MKRIDWKKMINQIDKVNVIVYSTLVFLILMGILVVIHLNEIQEKCNKNGGVIVRGYGTQCVAGTLINID